MTGPAPLRLGLLSTARINGAILGARGRTDAFEVAAVASRDPERAAAYAAEHGIPRAHGSYEALLADPDVDAVYVSLPNGLHVPWAAAALEAGKHVLCEKPLAATAAEAERAFDTAERAGLVLAEGFMWRHHPQAKLFAELVEEGAVGEVRLVRACFTFALTELGDVRMRADLEGGALADVGCYCVHGTRMVAGEPLSVRAEAVMAGGVDVRFAAVMRHDGDVLATFDAAFDLPRRSGLEVVGSTGTITLPDPWLALRPRLEIRREGRRVEEVAVERADRYACELEDFAAAVRGERPPLLGREDAVAQARVLEALRASAASGETVEL